METKIQKIDATGKRIGRLASQVAAILIGKNSVAFAKNIVPKTLVQVENAGKILVDEKKALNKVYKRYSGYPGGLKELNMEKVIAKKGMSEVLRLAVHNMLPHNKLRSKFEKNLKITE